MNGYGVQLANFINTTTTGTTSLTYSNIVSWRNIINIYFVSWQYGAGVSISPKI